MVEYRTKRKLSVSGKSQTAHNLNKTVLHLQLNFDFRLMRIVAWMRSFQKCELYLGHYLQSKCRKLEERRRKLLATKRRMNTSL